MIERPPNPAPSSVDLFALLSRVERDDRTFEGSVLSVEVGNLLGRERKVLDPSPPVRSGGGRDLSAPHGWYRAILASTPEVPEQFRVLKAARAVEAGLLAAERLAVNSSADSDEFREDLRELVQLGSAQFKYLVESNLRLVFYWARRLEHVIGEDLLQDAFQAGCLGLMRGIQGWDHEMGFSLSTYVSSHIRQSIQRWRHDETSVIRLPVHVWEKLNSNAEELNPSIRAAAERAQNMQPLTAIDAYAPTFAWDAGLDDVLVVSDRQRLVDALLWSLSEREAEVLILRHGLDSADTARTLDEVSKEFGLTRERIRQIEAAATKKLRERFSDDDALGLY